VPSARAYESTLGDKPALHRAGTGEDIPDTARARLRQWFFSDNWMSVLAVAIVVVAPLLLIVPLATHGGVYSNFGDGAANELSVQNAVHLHQTVGPYDRFGWFHPGPMLFYLMAIPYALMSWNGAGLEVGAGLINLAAAVGIVALVARRAGGKAALGTAALVCAYEFVLGAQHITNVWGPEVIVVPAALFFLLCADLATGGIWSLVGAVAVGSLLVQTEIGTGSAVALGVLSAICARVILWLKAGTFWQSLRQSIWPGVVAFVVGLIVWAPPVWQQLTGNPGNLGAVFGYFLHTHGHHSVGEVFSALATGMLAPVVGLFGNHGSSHHSHVEMAILFIAVAALATFCWQRRQWLAFALAAGIFPVAAVFSLSLFRVEGAIFDYVLLWTGALTLSAGIALVICLTAPRRPVAGLRARNDRARFLGALIFASCAVVSGWRLSDSAFRVKPGAGYVNITKASEAVERLLPRSAHRLLVCIPSAAAWPDSAGVVANLRKDGRDARVEPYWLYVFGRELAPTGREQLVVVLDTPGTRLPHLARTPEGSTTAGNLTIHVFQPPRGYVSPAVCPAIK
jgi:hypothetical protein